MTREKAIRKLMEVAKERFNSGKGIMINDIPFYNFGRKLEMKIIVDDDGNVASVDIMIGCHTVVDITCDVIREINVDFNNMLLEGVEKVFGHIDGEYFEIR